MFPSQWAMGSMLCAIMHRPKHALELGCWVAFGDEVPLSHSWTARVCQSITSDLVLPEPIPLRCLRHLPPQSSTVKTSLYPTPDHPWLQPWPANSVTLHRLRQHHSPARAERSLVRDAGASAPHRSTFVLASCPPPAGVQALAQRHVRGCFRLPPSSHSTQGWRFTSAVTTEEWRDGVQPLSCGRGSLTCLGIF